MVATRCDFSYLLFLVNLFDTICRNLFKVIKKNVYPTIYLFLGRPTGRRRKKRWKTLALTLSITWRVGRHQLFRLLIACNNNIEMSRHLNWMQLFHMDKGNVPKIQKHHHSLCLKYIRKGGKTKDLAVLVIVKQAVINGRSYYIRFRSY